MYLELKQQPGMFQFQGGFLQHPSYGILPETDTVAIDS